MSALRSYRNARSSDLMTDLVSRRRCVQLIIDCSIDCSTGREMVNHSMMLQGIMHGWVADGRRQGVW